MILVRRYAPSLVLALWAVWVALVGRSDFSVVVGLIALATAMVIATYDMLRRR